MIDILYHRRTFDTGNIPEEWPETFEDVVTILKRVGYVDPNVNTYRICAGKSHTTVFYPEGQFLSLTSSPIFNIYYFYFVFMWVARSFQI